MACVICLGALVGGAASADPTCTDQCTVGQTQCDATGNLQTCEEVGQGGTPGCTSAAELIYVVDENNAFSSFMPGSPPTFTHIGTLNCPANGGASPFSMSVDRNAVAWVLYDDGELFNVNTQNANCTATSYTPGQSGFTTYGMGFVADAAGGSTDTLFIASTAGKLGTLDTSSLTVTSIGSINGSPELTGTGLAQLFGFFPSSSNPRVSQLDKTTGAESGTMPLSMLAGNPEAWAFAYYAGDFWIFLKRFNTDNSTNVWHLNGSTGAVDDALPNTGRTIVGAGESTCVPTVQCAQWVSTPCPSNKVCSSGSCLLTCTDQCTAGQTQCDSSGNLQTCVAQNSGCYGWSSQSCGFTSACMNGQCVATCTSTCIPFITQCADGSDTETCTLQSSGCFDWNVTPCPGGEICSNGQCSTTCADACTLGATQCSQTITQTCVTGPSGCTQWQNGSDCGQPGCNNGACCPCQVGQTQCAADGSLQVCKADAEIGLCPQWQSEPCSATCQNGSCLATCNPKSELNMCPNGEDCLPMGTGFFCGTLEADGGIEAATSSTSGTGSASAGAGNASGGNTGNASGGSGNTGAAANTGTTGAAGAAGSGGAIGTTGSGAAGSSGSTSHATAGAPASATAAGCGCGPGGSGSAADLLMIVSGLVPLLRRRRTLRAG